LFNVYPDTVDTLNITKYTGLWYQMSADAIVYLTFEQNAYCVTAFYTDNKNGTIGVHNYARINSPKGEIYVIDGYAYQTQPTTYPGRLDVVFYSEDAIPYPAPYWILELGPENENEQYDWSIVSDSLSQFLFVLARNVTVFNEKYLTSVNAKLEQLGFTGIKKPIPTYQGTDCIYE
jgi:lipocalin